MLVSHRRRFIYTKTIKTGGTSVEAYFEPYCLQDETFVPQHARAEYVGPSGIVGHRGGGKPATCQWWNHMPAALIKQHLGDEVWSSYFKFCVVRNPYEKVISYYYFLRRGEAVAPEDDATAEAARFESWVTSAALPVDSDSFLIDGQFCLDHVVRYERLHAELAQVCERLGLPWQPSRLPRFKALFRPAWASAERLYTGIARAVVRDFYADDFERFGYAESSLATASGHPDG